MFRFATNDIVFTLLRPDHSPALGAYARTVVRAEPDCVKTPLYGIIGPIRKRVG